MTTENYTRCKQIAVKICGNIPDAEDLLHDAIIKMYDKLDDATLYELDQSGQVKFYLSRVMLNMFYNQKRLKKEYLVDFDITPQQHEQPNEEQIEEIKRILEMLKTKSKNDWFFAHLFELYHYEVFLSTAQCPEQEIKHTYRSLEAETNITLPTIYNSVKELTQYLKYRLND